MYVISIQATGVPSELVVNEENELSKIVRHVKQYP